MPLAYADPAALNDVTLATVALGSTSSMQLLLPTSIWNLMRILRF